MAEATARDVALDPQWLPHTYDVTGSLLTSVFVPRERRAELMFLSDEHFAGQFRKVGYPATQLANHARQAPAAPLHFVFHTSFCCSTLMLKALGAIAGTVGLQEPDVLINLGNRLIRADDRDNRERLRLVLRLLARPFAPGETIIVKPSNFANRLIMPILESSPDTRAVLLYGDVRSLIRSLLKRGMWGRIWGRRLFWTEASWSSLNLGYGPEETFVLTDLQALALGWLMQMCHFAEIAKRMGDRVMLVDSAEFLANPGETIRQVSRLFELGADDPAIDQVVKGPIFSRHSKFSDRDYGKAERSAEQDAAESAHHEEVEMVVKWLEAVAAHFGVDLTPAANRLAPAV